VPVGASTDATVDEAKKIEPKVTEIDVPFVHRR
jgi:hypothetical protein